MYVCSMINRYSYTDRYLDIHTYIHRYSVLSVSTTMMLYVWDSAGLEWRWESGGAVD